MLSIKAITEEFEVTRATLHNWKSTKPKLYNYLINYNNQENKYKNAYLVMQDHIKEININIFTYEDQNLNLKCNF